MCTVVLLLKRNQTASVCCWYSSTVMSLWESVTIIPIQRFNFEDVLQTVVELLVWLHVAYTSPKPLRRKYGIESIFSYSSSLVLHLSLRLSLTMMRYSTHKGSDNHSREDWTTLQISQPYGAAKPCRARKELQGTQQRPTPSTSTLWSSKVL